MTIEVRRLAALEPEQIEQLADILIGVVEAGASVGFLAPLDRAEAVAYWQGAVSPATVLLVAEAAGQIVGTGQLDLAQRANGRHRAEVCKVLVRPDQQGKGIGKALMAALEEEARLEGRSLLHLDTHAGDKSNRLYLSAGFTPAGTVPNWALGNDQQLHGTTMYYKILAG